MPGYKHPCRYCGELVEADANVCHACGKVNPAGDFRCHKCRAPVKEGWKACGSCGAALDIACPKCIETVFFGDYCSKCGARLTATHSFPDHHPFTRADIEALLAEAEANEATAVTTAKDSVRLPADLRARVSVLSVALDWEKPSLLTPLFDRIGVRA